MAEQTTVAETIDSFENARGDYTDTIWARGVSMSLLLRQVDERQVREGLEEALAVVRETQEPAEDLFGAPGDHADSLYARWLEDGRLHLSSVADLSWREVPSSGLAWSAFFAVGFATVQLIRGETTMTWTLGTVLIVVGMGIVLVAGATAKETLTKRHGFVAGLVGAGATIALSATALALANEWLRQRPLGTAGTWWFLVVAAACALGSTAWRRLVVDAGPAPAADPSAAPSAAPPVDADEWSRELAAILRVRHSKSDAQVSTILAEAHAHAAAAGHTVQDEFGTPEEYAARFGPDLLRRSRLKIAFYLFLAAMWLVPLAWGFSWFDVGVAACWVLLALREYRRYLRLRDQSGR